MKYPPPGRTYAGRQRCPSCDARLVRGEPSGKGLWTSLELPPSDISKLLTGAAEFDRMHDENVQRALERGDEPPERPTAVEFVDWMAPDLVRRPPWALPRYDGIAGETEWPPRTDDGARTTRGRAA